MEWTTRHCRETSARRTPTQCLRTLHACLNNENEMMEWRAQNSPRQMVASRKMQCPGRRIAKLIEKSFTSRSSAETGDSIVTAHLSLEFVVVGQLFVCNKLSVPHPPSSFELRCIGLTLLDVPQCIDHDSLRTVHSNDFGCTVRHAAVIDESGDAALFRCIHHTSFINAK